MDLVLIGAGGHGRVVCEIVQRAGQHRVVGFLDADPALAGQQIGGLPVLGPVHLLDKLRQQGVRGAIVAIGDNRVRRSYSELVRQSEMELLSAVHPSAVIAASAVLGKNVVVAAGAVVNPEARIGDSSIVNTGAIVEHECQLGEAVHLCPGSALGGRVTVGTGAFVGLGARVIPCLSVGDWAVVGAGAVVVRDIPPGLTVAGVPARLLETRRPR